MKVNKSKTNVLCVFDALSYSLMTYTFDSQGEQIDSSDTLKLLGFNFSDRPTVQLHVNVTIQKIRQRSWFLRNFGGKGFNNKE